MQDSGVKSISSEKCEIDLKQLLPYKKMERFDKNWETFFKADWDNKET